MRIAFASSHQNISLRNHLPFVNTDTRGIFTSYFDYGVYATLLLSQPSNAMQV